MKWKQIRIGDFGKVITGNTPPKKSPEYYGEEYKFIKPTDMEVGLRYTPVTEEYYSQIGFEKYRTSLIPPLSTCVVTIGTIGKKITLTEESCFINQAVNAVVPNTKDYDPFFVFYALRNMLHKVKAADTGASSGRENVSKSNFSNLTLEVPEQKQDQQRIGAALCAYDDLIENNTKRIYKLEESAQNIYKEWFINFHFPGYEKIEFENGLPLNWQKRPFKDIINFTNGFAFKSENYVDTGKYKIVTIKNVSDRQFDKTKFDCIDEIPTAMKDHCKIEEGDILLSLTGNVGRTCIAYGENLLLNQRVAIIKPNDSGYRAFIYVLFGIQDIISMMNNLSSGVAQQNLSPVKLGEQILFCPSFEMMEKYSELVEPILQQIVLLSKHNEILKEARDILLPRLMNRTIEV